MLCLLTHSVDYLSPLSPLSVYTLSLSPSHKYSLPCGVREESSSKKIQAQRPLRDMLRLIALLLLLVGTPWAKTGIAVIEDIEVRRKRDSSIQRACGPGV